MVGYHLWAWRLAPVFDIAFCHDPHCLLQYTTNFDSDLLNSIHAMAGKPLIGPMWVQIYYSLWCFMQISFSREDYEIKLHLPEKYFCKMILCWLVVEWINDSPLRVKRTWYAHRYSPYVAWLYYIFGSVFSLNSYRHHRRGDILNKIRPSPISFISR